MSDPQTQQALQDTSAPASAEGRADGPTFLPPTDIFETDKAILLVLDVPGADPQSVDITLEKRVLTVSARSTPFTPQGYTLQYAEYETGNYQRAFTLSDEIDREHIDASLKDGVLRLTAPKISPTPPRKITVKSA